MKRVYICSPFEDNSEENLKNVKEYMRYALECGTAPVVPHFYALCLDDRDPEKRKTGMDAGLSLLWICDECWVFGNELSECMNSEIRLCKSLNIPIRYIKNLKGEL